MPCLAPLECRRCCIQQVLQWRAGGSLPGGGIRPSSKATGPSTPARTCRPPRCYSECSVERWPGGVAGGLRESNPAWRNHTNTIPPTKRQLLRSRRGTEPNKVESEWKICVRKRLPQREPVPVSERLNPVAAHPARVAQPCSMSSGNPDAPGSRPPLCTERGGARYVWRLAPSSSPAHVTRY